MNIVQTFNDVDECIDFITDASDEKIFMIIPQVNSIYVLRKDNAEDEHVMKQWFMVKGIFTEITLICETLRQTTHRCEQNSISISYVIFTNVLRNLILNNTFIVYRGQGLSRTDFEKLLKTKDGLISFNNFLSTSQERDVSYAFAESNQVDPDLIGVLFEITIVSSTSSTSFANIRDVSYYQDEEEILISMHSVFRIDKSRK